MPALPKPAKRWTPSLRPLPQVYPPKPDPISNSLNQPPSTNPNPPTYSQAKNTARVIAGNLSSYVAVGGHEVAYTLVLERLNWLMAALEARLLGFGGGARGLGE
jgi:hypothetical protein